MIVAVWGHVGCGKTGLLIQLADALRQQGRVVGGVVQPRIFEGERLVGYALRDLLGGQQIPFAHRVSRGEGGGRRWRFDEAGWGWAAERLRDACHPADIIVLDELGLLESQGGGHLPALREILGCDCETRWVLGVRDRALSAVEQAVGGYTARVAVEDGVDGILRVLGCDGSIWENGPDL